MPPEPFVALGEFLTAGEAEVLAVQIASGRRVGRALEAIHPSRREHVGSLLAAAALSDADADRAAAVLYAIWGAKSVHRDLTPVWTMPGNEATIGHLTSEFHRLVRAARRSVVCATYNFEPTSQMWTGLREAGESGAVVTVYVDGDKADAAKVRAQLPKATIYRSAELASGQRVVSHAKFVIIDQEILLLTSANFSFSAEKRNIEFGLLVRDAELAGSVEATMRSKHGRLYVLVD